MSLNPNLPDFPRDMEGRIIFERLDENGNVIERSFGSSEKERLDDHNNHACDMWCGYCYEGACNWLNEQEKLESQEQYKESLKHDY